MFLELILDEFMTIPKIENHKLSKSLKNLQDKPL